MRDIHEAAFAGDIETVRRLLDDGADPDVKASNLDGRWLSCEDHPTPLHCTLIAHDFGERHLEIVRLLLANRAQVRESHIKDFCVEASGSKHDTAAWKLLRERAPPLNLSDEAPWDQVQAQLRSRAGKD
ncbi:MAG: hypothetical protein HY901_30475 [Deltaproteobacteria bacterium]|nr:hypothetical protein [Deltaproteobacteria bacterium]